MRWASVRYAPRPPRNRPARASRLPSRVRPPPDRPAAVAPPRTIWLAVAANAATREPARATARETGRERDPKFRIDRERDPKGTFHEPQTGSSW